MKFTFIILLFFFFKICEGQVTYESHVLLHMDKSVDYRNYSKKHTRITISDDTIRFEHLDKNLSYKWVIVEKEVDSNNFRTLTYLNTVLATKKKNMAESARIVLYQNKEGIQFVQFELPPAGDSELELPLIERYIITNN